LKLNLLNEKYVFQKRKRILWNTLWTAGSKSKELRGSLANFPREGVSASTGRLIQDERFGLGPRRRAAAQSPEKKRPRRRDIAGGEESRRRKHTGRFLPPFGSGLVPKERGKRGGLT